MSPAQAEEEWSWVSADGHLRSGTRDELMRWYADGRIPAQNPVKKSDWTDWISVGELVAPPTEPYNAMPFDEGTFSRRRQRLLSMSDDVTVPKGIPAVSSDQAQMIVEIVPPPAHSPASVAPAPRKSSWLWIALAALALSFVAFVAVVAVFVFRKPPAKKAAAVEAPVATTSAPAPPPPALTACVAKGERTRLLAAVPPAAAIHVGTNAGRLAVGVPTAERAGVGLVVDPEKFSILETRAVADSTRVAGVVPSGSGFSVDRFATRVPETDFSLGMTPNGLSRLGDDSSQNIVWEGEATLPITRPSIVHLAGRGYAVAFRRGEADVRAGWIDERGAKKSDLVQLASTAQKSSAPSLASSGNDVLATFSTVDADGISRIVLADLSPKLRTLPTTGESPRAPSIVSLGAGRFLVAWLEGSVSTGRSLHARVVGSDLAPAGPDQSLATFALPVESIALWRDGSRAAVLLSERAANSRNELFALGLDCK